MRPDKTVVLINAVPWLIDFRRNRFTQLPQGIHRALSDLSNLFGRFDSDGAFQVWRKAIRYKDYAAADEIMQEDAASNREKHARAEQPPLELSDLYEGGAVTPLEGANDPVLKVCDVLLKHSMWCQSVRPFHDDQIQLRPSPSVGARHGIDVFVRTRTGLHYYSGSQHALLHTGADAPSAWDIEFIFVCRAEVYMWRYPQGSCLLDVYFDYGHILGNVALAAVGAGAMRPSITEGVQSDLALPEGAMVVGQVAVDCS